jgi:transposase
MARRKIGPEQEKEVVAMYTAGQSTTAIAEHLDVHCATIRMALARHRVPMRGGKPRHATDEVTVAAMTKLYVVDGWSQKQIGEQFDISQPVVSRILELAGVEMRRGATGEDHGNWRGGRFVQNGYVFVRVYPGDPFYVMANRCGYVLENRLVMARHLGRPLLRSETVHHKNNQDEQNNDISNLQLRQGRHGKGGAFQCADCGSHNIKPVPLAEGALQ